MPERARDIVVTWPKTRPLESYVSQLAHAHKNGLVINYRVANLPIWEDSTEDHGFTSWSYGGDNPRCFMVHTGWVRGWCQIIGTCYREDWEVDGWPAGKYIVRSPLWHPLKGGLEEAIPMKGFQGWRWFDGKGIV